MNNDGKSLIQRIEEYFATAAIPEGSFRPNNYSTIHDGKHYVKRSIQAMKNVRPFTSQFNAAYNNLLSLKEYLENEKQS